jgi:hypothetical protein
VSADKNGKKGFVLLAVAAALATGIAPAPANDTAPDHEDIGGAVTPCSLDGINPAYHQKIFGNPAVARAYGFVRASDGTWHVLPNCRR